ncbi:LysR substrate-binding domain-containing protein [Streptomyces sp. NPDC059802]|uniref:LysR substrate-binding domain-containing protein n=1 Tax=Streptomyces sp. NPDC059802 TaxID=3346952 RepID=UPI00364677CB
MQTSLREATTPELVAGLRAGELDLAHLAPDAAELPEGIVGFATWHEDLVLITAPGHRPATAGRTLIKDLSDEPFVDFRAGTGPETAVRRLAAHCGLERRITCDVTQIRLLDDLVRAGIGVAIVPRRIGEDAGLPCLSIRRPEPGRTVVLAGRASGPREPGSVRTGGPELRNPAAQALLDRLAGPTDAGHAAAGRPGGPRPPAD